MIDTVTKIVFLKDIFNGERITWSWWQKILPGLIYTKDRYEKDILDPCCTRGIRKFFCTETLRKSYGSGLSINKECVFYSCHSRSKRDVTMSRPSKTVCQQINALTKT